MLVRHAPTAANLERRFGADEPLHAAGVADARALRPARPPDARILTSPARRARETAAALGFDPQPDPRLAECDFGAWRGRTLADIHAEDPQAVADWMRDPAWAPPGGESLVALLARVRGWMQEMAAGAEPVVAITHSGVIRAAVVWSLDAPAPALWRIEVPPLSATVLEWWPEGWTVRLTSGDLHRALALGTGG